MKKIIKNLISIAEKTENLDTKYEILNEIKNLIYTFAIAYNCPSNWRDIAEELAEEYADNSFIYEALQLYDYAEQFFTEEL